MKTFELKNIFLGDLSTKAASEIAFSDKVLKKVHGEGSHITPWKDNHRNIKYKMNIPDAPSIMKRFLVGDHIDVNITQIMKTCNENRYDVESQVKLNCIGSRLIKIQPSFSIERNSTTSETFFNAKVNVSVRAFPPINHIAENFMIIQAEQDILGYAKNILENI